MFKTLKTLANFKPKMVVGARLPMLWLLSSCCPALSAVCPRLAIGSEFQEQQHLYSAEHMLDVELTFKALAPAPPTKPTPTPIILRFELQQELTYRARYEIFAPD